MRCPGCGTEADAESRYCPVCGTALQPGIDAAEAERIAFEKGDTAELPVINLPEDALHQGSLRSHIFESRAKSRKQMPLFLLILMSLLFAVTVTALVVATYFFIEQVVVPFLQEQQTELALIQEDTLEREDTADNVPTDGAATPVAPAFPQTVAPAVDGAPAATQDSQAAPTPVALEDNPAYQAIFNDILTTYHDSQAQGWSNAFGSDLIDLNALGIIVMLQDDYNPALTYSELMNGTVSYAYADFSGDGQLDLAIAAIQDDGSYRLMALYASDSADPAQAQAVSLMQGAITIRAYWRIRDDLTLERSGADGAWAHFYDVYMLSNGELQETMSFGYDNTDPFGGGESYYYLTDETGTRTDLTYEEFAALRDVPTAQLDWQPLELFEAVVPDDETATGDDSGQLEPSEEPATPSQP